MRRALAWCWPLCLIGAIGCGVAGPSARATWTPAELAAQSRCESGDITGCGALGRSLVRRARDMRDIERGLVLLEGACGGDDLPACAALGDWYRVQDDDRDHARATALLTRACDGHAGDGCRALGELALERRDVAGAVLLFDQACALGDAEGCEKSGVFARKLDASDAVAEPSLERACELGRLSSCHLLGMIQLRHPATAADGSARLARTCIAGHAASCLPAAATFAPVFGGQPDCGRAADLAQRACAAGMPDGCAIHEACAMRDPGGRAAALARLRSTCDQGISLACFYWADAQPAPATAPPAPVVAAYQSACGGHSAGADTACTRLALLALQRATSSDEVTKPLETLGYLCDRAARAACCALADIYIDGHFVPPDSTRATHFRSACAPVSSP